MNRILIAAGSLLFASTAALAEPKEHHRNDSKEHHHNKHEHKTHAHHEAFAAGELGDPAKPSRQVKVLMQETSTGMVFVPSEINVAKDEQIEFLLENAGELEHEFVLDTKEGNQKHKALMEEHAGMAHSEPNEKELKPGEKTVLLWRFTKPGNFEYACLIPGHYEAGMHGTVTVK